MCSLLKSEHKNKTTLAIICILLLLSYVFWSMSVHACGRAEREYGKLIQMRLGDEPLSVSHVASILEKRDFENEDTKYTAWSQKSGINVENESLGTRAGLDTALYYYGDNYGKFNLIRDNGCALSKNAAFKLFGTTQGVLGEFVIIDGERYVVEKLIYGGAVPLIYKVKGENTDNSFDVLDIIPGQETAFSASELQMSVGVNSDIVINYEDVIKSFSALGKFVLWVALIFAALYLLSGITRGANELFSRTVMYGGLFLAAFGCYILVGPPVFIPDNFIPTRWSEFEFWSAVFTQFGDALKYYFSMKTYAPDLVFRSYILQTLTFALISAVLIIFASAAGRGIIKERGTEIGTSNFKEYYETICGKFQAGSS